MLHRLSTELPEKSVQGDVITCLVASHHLSACVTPVIPILVQLNAYWIELLNSGVNPTVWQLWKMPSSKDWFVTSGVHPARVGPHSELISTAAVCVARAFPMNLHLSSPTWDGSSVNDSCATNVHFLPWSTFSQINIIFGSTHKNLLNLYPQPES